MYIFVAQSKFVEVVYRNKITKAIHIFSVYSQATNKMIKKLGKTGSFRLISLEEQYKKYFKCIIYKNCCNFQFCFVTSFNKTNLNSYIQKLQTSICSITAAVNEDSKSILSLYFFLRTQISVPILLTWE